MVCKFCNAEIEDGVQLCPHCGKAFDTERETVLTSDEMPPVVEVETDVPEQPSESPETTQTEPEETCENKERKSPREVLTLVFSIVAAVLALCALTVVLMMALGVFDRVKKSDPAAQVKPSETAPADDIVGEIPEDVPQLGDGYTVDDETAKTSSLNVVATMGDKKLTNVQLRFYYRMQIIDFLNYYGAYASQIGFDYTKPLSEQVCYLDETKSWEEYMVDRAIDTWKNYQTMCMLAEEAGYELSGEWMDALEQAPEALKKQAEEDGFDTVDALLESAVGPGCTEKEYLEFIRVGYLSGDYYDHLVENAQPGEADIEAYFAENEETLTAEGLTKDMGMVSDVRHILIMPKGGTTDSETGETVYSEEEWKTARKEAERILKEWEKGEATEESFALLANTYSEDGGSNTTGGLYEQIAPGASYVENFLNWSIDMSRQVGDTDIVETEFGYHIMYYVSGEPYWISIVSERMVTDYLDELTTNANEKWPIEIDYDSIALAPLNLS